MAQSLGSFAADAPRYGADAEAAYYALKGAGGTAAGVTSLQTLTGDLVLASSDSSVVFTTSVGGINLSVPNALPGSVKTVVGTANQVGVVTAAGTATVALAPPSPAPTAGTYLGGRCSRTKCMVVPCCSARALPVGQPTENWQAHRGRPQPHALA